LVYFGKNAECCYSRYLQALNVVNLKNGPPKYSEDNTVQILDECDLSDLENVLSESDDEFIPQGDASESENNLEVNSEESDIAGAISDVDFDDDDEFIAKSGRV
jgi:hypothetical protein